jgi:hypothetical protein
VNLETYSFSGVGKIKGLVFVLFGGKSIERELSNL